MTAGDFVVRRNAALATVIPDIDKGVTDVEWDTAVDNKGTGITYSAGVFTLGETGRFLVMASDKLTTTNVENNQRTTVDLQFRLAGSTLREGAGSGYLRRGFGAQDIIPMAMAYVNVATTTGDGDELTVRLTRLDESTQGEVTRDPDRSGVSIIKLDDSWNYGHYRSTAAFTPATGANVRNQSEIGTTVEQDGTVFSRSGNQVTVTTSNPVLVMLTHQADYTDVVSGRTEMQQSIDFDGAELDRGFAQVYGPRASVEGPIAASMTSATIIYPDGTGQILEGNLIGRQDADEDWFCELQLIELPPSAETATVERSTPAGDFNAAGANFAFETAINVDTAAFTHTPGQANIDVDNTDDYLAIANVGTLEDPGVIGIRAVPAQGFRVNTTDQPHVGNSSFNRSTTNADHASLFTAAILPGLAANDSVQVRHDRLGTESASFAGTGGFSLVRLSSLFGPAGPVQGTGALAYGYTLTADGTKATEGVGSLTYGGTVTAAGTPGRLGTATAAYGYTLTATGTIPSGTVTVTGIATLAYGGTTTATGTLTKLGTGTLDYGGDTTGTGQATRLGTATASYGYALTGTGTIPTDDVTGTAALDYGGTLTAAGQVIRQGTATLSYGGSIAATGQRTSLGTATATYGGTTTATGVIPTGAVLGTASLTYGGTTAATGQRTHSGVTALAYGGTVAGTASVIKLGTATATYGGTLTATGVIPAPGIVTGTAALTYGGTTTATGQRTRSGTAALNYGGTLHITIDPTTILHVAHTARLAPPRHTARLAPPRHHARISR